MSKTRNKSHSELEHVRGQLKAVRRENRQLRKRLREVEKKSHFYENIVDEFTEDTDIKDTCSECGKGEMIYYDLIHVKLEVCNLCGYKRNLTSGKKIK